MATVSVVGDDGVVLLAIDAAAPEAAKDFARVIEARLASARKMDSVTADAHAQFVADSSWVGLYKMLLNPLHPTVTDQPVAT